MNDKKPKSLAAKEITGFLAIMIALFFTVSTGFLVGTFIIGGFAIVFKYYIYRQYKKADLLDLFWKNTSKAGFGAGITILVLVLMSYFDVTLF